MYYLIYKITNKINNKIYIGSHKTKNINDNYMGSGKYLKRSIKEHGIESFKKEILFVFDNAKDMYNKEKELVNEDFLTNENTYNLNVGGYGGWDYINSTYPKAKQSKKLGHKNSLISMRNKYGNEFQTKMARSGGETTFKESKGIFDNKYNYIRSEWLKQAFLGRKHSDKTKRMIGHKNSIHQIGSLNSQYGTCWITNGKENKKIKKEELDNWIKLGYYRGRIFFNKISDIKPS